jgi:hypothetical protein
MDENLAVGTASRSHLHGIYNATYLAQWSRTGKPVERIADFGQAFTHFVQNGRRPGEAQHEYRHQHFGEPFRIGPSLWGDDGRPFALQSGPTALIVYVPKGQERWYVRRLEVMMVVPRLDIVDAVLVDGEQVDEYEGPPEGTVVVCSGNAALGLRFAACDPELCSPQLRVERMRDHLFVGLRLVDFPEQRELPEPIYRRYGAAIGAELRYAPTDQEVATLVQDIRNADLTDTWRMADFGGPREVCFCVAGKRLYGRFDPIGETWLRRDVPEPTGRMQRIVWNARDPLGKGSSE